MSFYGLLMKRIHEYYTRDDYNKIDPDYNNNTTKMEKNQRVSMVHLMKKMKLCATKLCCVSKFNWRMFYYSLCISRIALGFHVMQFLNDIMICFHQYIVIGVLHQKL